MNTQSAEFQAALHDHAKALGVDPFLERHLLTIVQEALLAELPVGWEQGQTDDGTPYYFHAETEQSTWEHPLDEHYRQEVQLAKEKTRSALSSEAPIQLTNAHETEHIKPKNRSLGFGRDTSWLLDEEIVVEHPVSDTKEVSIRFTMEEKIKLENDLEKTRNALQKAQQAAKETSYYKMKLADSKVSHQRLKEASQTLERSLEVQIGISKERFECICMAGEEVLQGQLQVQQGRIILSRSKEAYNVIEQELERFKSITKERESEFSDQLETLQLQQIRTKSQEAEESAQALQDAQSQLVLERTLQKDEDHKQLIKLQEELVQSMKSVSESKEIAQKRFLEVQELQLLLSDANTRASNSNEDKLTALTGYEASRQQDEKTIEALRLEKRGLESALERERLSHARSHEEAEKWQHCERVRVEDQLAHSQRQVSDAEAQKREWQNQVVKLQDQIVALNAKWQNELVDAQQQARAMYHSQQVRLEKQVERLERELEDALNGFQDAQSKLRDCRQQISLEKHHIQQIALDLDDKTRWEATLRLEKEKLIEELHSTRCQLASLQVDFKSLKHEKTDEKERFHVRIRELESRLKQKEYDILRLEECATKAESWRQREAKRVEDRNCQILRLSEEIAHSKQQNSVELDLKKELLDAQQALCDLQRHSDDRERHHQKQFQELEQSIASQLPQLASKCVSRASEKWTEKCKEMMHNQRETLLRQAKDERENLIQTFDCREKEWTQTHSRIVEESEILRRDLRKMENVNELLSQQLQMQWTRTQNSISTPRTIFVQPNKSPHVSPLWPKVAAAWEKPIVTEEMTLRNCDFERPVDSKQLEAEEKELLRSLESLGKANVSRKIDCSECESSTWYRKDYWRHKYQ